MREHRERSQGWHHGRHLTATLAALVGGLDRRHAEATALDQLRVVGGFRAIVNGLDDGKQAAGQHQKDNDDGHGKLSSVFDFLSVLF